MSAAAMAPASPNRHPFLSQGWHRFKAHRLGRWSLWLFLLLFGLRGYVKAIRRFAGRTKLHDEAKEFAETRHKIDHAEARVAWAVAFKGMLLEGLEVWLLVPLGCCLGAAEAPHTQQAGTDHPPCPPAGSHAKGKCACGAQQAQ